MPGTWRLRLLISAGLLACLGLGLTEIASSPIHAALSNPSAGLPTRSPSHTSGQQNAARLDGKPAIARLVTPVPSNAHVPGPAIASPVKTVTSSAPVPGLGGASAIASPVKAVGYNAHVLGQPDPARYVGLIESGGATSLRDNVYWASVEPSSGHFNWSGPDEIVTEAATHHLHVLLVVGAAPAWESSVAKSASYQLWLPPRSAAVYGEFAGMVAARYGVGGQFWQQHPTVPEYLPAGLELWNEENLSGSWGGQTPNPQLYAAMVRAAYTSIKRADPNMTVVTGGLAPAGAYDDVACTGRNGTGYDATGWNPLNYLKALYADGIHGYFDAVGWHPYNYWKGATAVQMLAYNSCSGWSQMDLTPVSVRSLMAANGDAGKQVWVTEAGASTCVPGATYVCVSPNQETLLAESEVRDWQGLSWAGGFYWYDVRDDQVGAQNMESHFGAVAWPDSPEPVYQALLQAWG